MDEACFLNDMKLLLLVSSLLLIGCKSDPPNPPEEPKPDPKAQQEAVKALRVEQAKLLNQKHALQKKLNKLVAKSNDGSSGEIKAVLAEQQQARIEYQTIRTTHPSLIKLNSELSDWRRILRTSQQNQRDSEIAQAQTQIIETTSKIHTLSQELPALREAQDRINRCEKELTTLRRALAEKTPEGQAIIEELAEIDKALNP